MSHSGDVDAAAARLCDALDGRQFLVACPGLQRPAKRWPVENYREVLRRFLGDELNARIGLLGNPSDRDLRRRTAMTDPPQIGNGTGDVSIEESAALGVGAACHFRNGTDAMHMAVRWIAIFSARDYRGKWEPFGTGHTILRSDPLCRGCMLVECTTENLRCLTEVSSSAALEALEACWRTAAEAGPRRSSAVSS